MNSPNQHVTFYCGLQATPQQETGKARKRFSINNITESAEGHSTRVSKVLSTKRLSIFDLDKIQSNGIREDAYGNIIIKGSKTHKVSFIDTVSARKLAEVILIDSDMTAIKKDKTANCHCSTSCLIF